jgi:hypothetical protein
MALKWRIFDHVVHEIEPPFYHLVGEPAFQKPVMTSPKRNYPASDKEKCGQRKKNHIEFGEWQFLCRAIAHW